LAFCHLKLCRQCAPSTVRRPFHAVQLSESDLDSQLCLCRPMAEAPTSSRHRGGWSCRWAAALKAAENGIGWPQICGFRGLRTGVPRWPSDAPQCVFRAGAPHRRGRSSPRGDVAKDAPAGFPGATPRLVAAARLARGLILKSHGNASIFSEARRMRWKPLGSARTADGGESPPRHAVSVRAKL
jgi:hypothetical protein